MKVDPGSLDRMRDIVEPERVSWWPPAPGWWGLAVLLLVAVAVVSRRWYRRWQANAYRREAIRALGDATNIQELDRILKRAALVAGPRESVASLSGDDWCHWLGSMATGPMPEGLFVTLSEDVFRRGEAGIVDAHRRWAETWLREHRVSENRVSENRVSEHRVSEQGGDAC